MKTVETIIKERPDCPNAPLNIPSPGDRGGIGGNLAGMGCTSQICFQQRCDCIYNLCAKQPRLFDCFGFCGRWPLASH
jgi:hypothetical protein